jgi:hypothetical protein
MTARGLVLLFFALAAAPFYGYLFVRGLRQRKVITFSNLHAERNQSPATYWIFQAYYAVVAIMAPLMIALLISGYKFGRTAAIDRPLAILFGVFFMFGAVVIGTTGILGLRTGVAVRSSWASRRPPPSRKNNPIRYWSLEAFYLLATLMCALLGALMILAALK